MVCVYQFKGFVFGPYYTQKLHMVRAKTKIKHNLGEEKPKLFNLLINLFV